MFITSKDVTQRDLKGDENKIKQFLKDIRYRRRGDTKSNRSKLIKKLLISIGEPTFQVISIPTSSEDEIYRRDTSEYEQGAVEEEEGTDYEADKQIGASGLSRGLGCYPRVDPNSLIKNKNFLY